MIDAAVVVVVVAVVTAVQEEVLVVAHTFHRDPTTLRGILARLRFKVWNERHRFLKCNGVKHLLSRTASVSRPGHILMVHACYFAG